MARDNFEIKFGSEKAPVKCVIFISASCTFCNSFMLRDYSKLARIAKTGSIQFGIYPFLRGEYDELMFTQILASGMDPMAAYLTQAKFVTAKRRPKRKRGVPMIDYVTQNQSAIGIPIRPYDKIRNSKTIRANLSVYNQVARHLWRVKQVPVAILNGLIMYNPDKGKLVREAQRIEKTLKRQKG